jgi:predicted TIM-barrel fold metal-dependent hydrolase
LIIDTHIHVGTPDQWNMEVVSSWFEPFGLDPNIVDIHPEDVLAMMDDAGVDLAFILALNLNRHLGVWIRNEYVASLCQQWPERFIGFCSVDPVRGKAAVAELKHAINDLGLRGLKLGPTYQNYNPSDPRAYLVYAAAEEMGVPVLIHQGWTAQAKAVMEYQYPTLLDSIMVDFPDLRVIIAHMGMPWQKEALFIAAKHPHCYVDISARQLPSYGGGMRTVFRDLHDALDLDIAHKVFWGTDFPWCTERSFLEELRNINQFATDHRPPLSAEVLDGVIGGNAFRFMQSLGWVEATSGAKIGKAEPQYASSDAGGAG